MTLSRFRPQRLRATLHRRLQVPRQPLPEEGDTLIEVILAVVVIALTAAALLGAITTSIVSSASHRYLSTDDTLLRSYAEQVEYQLEQSPNALGPTPIYQSCAPAGATGPYNTTANPSLAPDFPVPSGYGLAITGVQYWGYPMQLTGRYAQGASVSDFAVPALPFTIYQGTTILIGDQVATVSADADANTTQIPVENAFDGPFVTDAAYTTSTWLYKPGWYSFCQKQALGDPTNGFPGNDLQELTITVTAPTGVSEQLQILVRNPAYV
jgi:hypothetical protein